MPCIIVVEDDNTLLFFQISYLGCSSIENPSSEKEMLKIVALMNAEKEHGAIAVILSVPSSSFGTVRFVVLSFKNLFVQF